MTATLKVYPNGASAGVVPTTVRGGLRSDVSGWTLKSSRSNTRFLYSVRAPELDGYGLALTLTVRECPTDHEAWKRAREALCAFLRRRGMLRLHWITEWQRRGVPHLHAAVWFPDPGHDLERQRLALLILAAWLRISAPFQSGQRGQTVKPIADELGWLQYLSKHAARGAAHYQRAAEGIPEGWARTGRMWGYLGEWPRDDPLEVDLDWPGFFRFRRLCRSYAIAQARGLCKPGVLRARRRMLRCPHPSAAPFRGVSQWIPRAVVLDMVAWLASQGASVAA